MATLTSTEWALARRPVGLPQHSDFQKKTVDVPDPGPGQIQVQNSWMSVDPYMRGRMYDRESYVPPFGIGETMTGGAVGRVTASQHPDYKPGDLVQSMNGWRTAWTSDPGSAMSMKLPETGLPESAFLGVAGMPGLTAYAGILRIAELKEGDTVFVSGAAGAVGSTVVQIAKIKGCRAVGIAGGPDKCRHIVEDLGFDAAVDYKAPDWREQLKAATPNGIDVNFENVGGEIMEAVVARMNLYSRMPLCGMISTYNDAQRPRYDLSPFLMKRIRLQGFIILDFKDRYIEGSMQLAQWLMEGKLKARETVVEGLDKAPEALNMLFDGSNIGKLIVKI